MMVHIDFKWNDFWFVLPKVFYYREYCEEHVYYYGFRRYWEFSWLNFSIEVTI